MNDEMAENAPAPNEGAFNASEYEESTENPGSQTTGKVPLNYGDVVIMIWRRVKLNEKMTERLKY